MHLCNGSLVPAVKPQCRVWLETDKATIRSRFGEAFAVYTGYVGILSFEEVGKNSPRYLGTLWHGTRWDSKKFAFSIIGKNERRKQVQTIKAALKICRQRLEQAGWEVVT